MATMRIKYKKQKDGTDKSRILFSKKYNTYYYVVKDETQDILTFRIVNNNQKRAIYEHKDSKITNKAVLYRTIREKLVGLGVELKAEIRPHQKAPSNQDRVRGGRNNVKSVTDE